MAIFKHKTDTSGDCDHVAYVYDVDDNYIYLSEQDYYTGKTYTSKLSKTPKTPHPRSSNLVLVGFRGTHASLAYVEKTNKI